MRKFFLLLVLFFADCLQSADVNFFVVIPTFNNANRCLANLISVLNQDYPASLICIIDDDSTDGTGEILDRYIEEHNLADKVIIIHNKQRRLGLCNIICAIYNHCPDDRYVVVTVDGDDELNGPHAFARVAQEYMRTDIPEVWLTYGQYINIPRGDLGICHEFPGCIIQQNRFREYRYTSSQLRTFRAGLFKQIKLEDLLDDDGRPYSVAWDVALMIPQLEMASHGHFRFIPEIIYKYFHHEKNDYVHNFQQMMLNERKIRNRKKYQPLDELCYNRLDAIREEKASLIVFSYHRPLQLYAFLESVKKYTTGLSETTVIYRADSDEFEKAYEVVKRDFPDVIFSRQSIINPHGDFKALTCQAVDRASNYILFAVDDIILKDFLDLHECIYSLEQTYAYGFYLRLGKNTNYCYSEARNQGMPIKMMINDHICVWQFKNGIADWKYKNNVDMTLMRKKEIVKVCHELNYYSPNSFEAAWATMATEGAIGLCYEDSKIVNIPCNRVQNNFMNRNMEAYTHQDLLIKFNHGLKIDIGKLFKYENSGAHEEINFTFIPR